jgi:mRNA-degrading endonuclease RelE of RelBE toxin-antitoxin system
LTFIRQCRTIITVVFIESHGFTKLLPDYLSEDEYLALQLYLVKHPDSGEIVRGSGGVRKMRWAMSGKGKRSGLRIIYYWKNSESEIWLLTLYAKNEAETIPAHILKQIAREIDDEKT